MNNNQLKFRNIVNIEELKILFESFSSATGFTTGLVEQETNEVLIGTGWRDICTRFHRINPDSVAHCQTSNQELTANLSTPGEIRISHCQNGLVDGCTPLIIEGKHLANIFTGQVLFASPDINFFKKQIHQYHYDPGPYLKSLSEVPVVNEETFRAMLLFLSQISMMIANSGLATLKSRESEERLNTIFEATLDGIFVADTKSNKITTANKAGCLMLGYSLEEIQSIKVSDLPPTKDAPFVIEQFAKQLKSEIPIAQDIPVKRKDGSIFYADISSSPMKFEDKQYLIGIFRDITDKKQAANELLKMKKLESVGILAGGIAHDFNNILSAIIGNIELAEIYTDHSSKSYPLLTEAKKASIRAKDLTQQLLTFSKGGDPVKSTTSLATIVKDSANFILHGSSVIADYSFPENLWPVNVDTGQISQVIQNIILNARHAMPSGGVIEVSCQNITQNGKIIPLLPNGRYLKLTITDSGLGIPAKFMDQIFDPYFSTKQEGSGLGLAISHSIIKKHDGDISVQSEIEKGTTFTIYLPASTKIEKEVLPPGYGGASLAEIQATVMVMDDDSMVREMVKQMLSRSGYEIILVKNGHEAIELYRKHFESNCAIDIVIMDLTIPGGMGGKDTVPEILKINPDAKVVVASGYSNDPVMAHYQDYGFAASIAKPFQLAELNKLVNTILQQ